MDGGAAVQTHFISELGNLEHDIEHFISELGNLEHDIEHGFSSSSGQEQGPVTDLICSDDLIYSVPADIASKEQQQNAFKKEIPLNLFSPCIVSIGPLNFNPPSSSSSLMGNEIKKEALRKMIKEHAAHGTNQTSASLTQLFRWIEAREEEIKECYADRAKIPHYLSGSTFASIMLLDSCFLLQLLESVNEERHFNKDEWPRLATVLDDRHMKAMAIQDIFKIGNQIPLFVVQEVAKAFQKSFEHAIAETLLAICPLRPEAQVFELDHQVGTLCSSEKPHLLSLFHRFMCGTLPREMGPKQEQKARDPHDKRKRQPKSTNVPSRVAWNFLFVAFILITFVVLFGLAIGTVIVVLGVVILLLPFFIIACLWPHHRMKQQEASWFRVKAEILAHHMSIKGCCGNIEVIRYTPGDSSSLCLPETEAGETSRVVLHNMIAMERCSQRVHKKTVCNYAILMAKLLQTPTDVQVLERSNVLFRMDKDRSWTVRMFRDLHESAAAAELRFLDWTDGCLKTLRQLQEEEVELPKLPRWKGIRKSMMFWVKDLGNRYAANPWVALSTAAAATLLLMTGAQVVCLFITCNSSSKS